MIILFFLCLGSNMSFFIFFIFLLLAFKQYELFQCILFDVSILNHLTRVHDLT